MACSTKVPLKLHNGLKTPRIDLLAGLGTPVSDVEVTWNTSGVRVGRPTYFRFTGAATEA